MPITPIDTLYETFVANLSWEVTKSVASCQACLAAAVELAARRPVKVEIDGNSVAFDYVLLRSQIDFMRRFLADNDTTLEQANASSAVRVYDMSDMRR